MLNNTEHSPSEEGQNQFWPSGIPSVVYRIARGFNGSEEFNVAKPGAW
jgi:hypothetical protein